MANKMLIDAAHPEETRVVVLRGSRVEEFDFEAASKKQLRGNIYLAKVTRVEPSLQAAFVDYGGNRHGFLAFSEIHPDYYQIPISDRQALIEAEAQEEPEEEERRPQRRSRRHRRGDRPAAADMHRAGDEAVSEAAHDDRHPSDTAPEIGHAAEAARDLPLVDAHPDDTRPSEGSRPVEIAATETPPYDDPTPKLIERAEIIHERLDTMEPDASLPPESPAEPDPTQHDPIQADPSHAKATDTAPEASTAAAATDAHSDDSAIVSDAQVDTGSADHGHDDHGHDDAGHDDAGHEHHPHDHDHDHDAHTSRHPDHGDEADDDHEEDVSAHVEQLGGDAMEELPIRVHRSRKQYKIQEVIKRRQVLLVQVVKEERGNKGAAITTYLSLAGRYSVLMPNTAKGGGISRKITDAGDRQRLKTIAQDLEVPDGMGVILRTAGASRTKPEVKRDFEYLMRMWETVRETTLNSQAPTLVYEEGSLIKRAIRDLYNKDVDEVIVAGEAAYREAKDFMRMLMPSHARNVQPWRDPQPIFAKAGAEAQLDAMFSSHVTLKSGGYIVINQTEALVAIDVNSGRSTREHNIEDTALRTNLEAADEVARQLRLRDLAGLIVVDFIDMEEGRNNRAVEKRIKDALKNDRARIQVGRISHFGLLEMSRQRIRTGVLEGSTVVCEHCAGAGMVRSTSSIALHVLRVLEDGLISDASHNVIVRTRSAVALYILNQKRLHLADLEARFGVVVTFIADETLTGTAYTAMERGDPATGTPQPSRLIPKDEPDLAFEEDEEIESLDETETAETGGEPTTARDGSDADGQRRKRRRRRRGRDRESSGISDDAPQPADDALAFVADVDAARLEHESDDETAEREEKPAAMLDEPASGVDTGRGEGRRRRSRRGGRRNREETQAVDHEAEPAFTGEEAPTGDAGHHAAGSGEPAAHPAMSAAHDAPDASALAVAVEPEPAVLRAADLRASDLGPAELEPAELEPAELEPAKLEPADLGAADLEAAAPTTSPEEPAATSAAEPLSEAPPVPRRPELVSSEPDPAQPKRSGWWQRAKATLGG